MIGNQEGEGVHLAVGHLCPSNRPPVVPAWELISSRICLGWGMCFHEQWINENQIKLPRYFTRRAGMKSFDTRNGFNRASILFALIVAIDRTANRGIGSEIHSASGPCRSRRPRAGLSRAGHRRMLRVFRAKLRIGRTKPRSNHPGLPVPGLRIGGIKNIPNIPCRAFFRLQALSVRVWAQTTNSCTTAICRLESRAGNQMLRFEKNEEYSGKSRVWFEPQRWHLASRKYLGHMGDFR